MASLPTRSRPIPPSMNRPTPGRQGTGATRVDLSDEGDQLFESLDTVTGDGVAAGLERVEEITHELESAAPEAIADDVSFLTEYTGQLIAALAEADYVLLDIDLSGLDLVRLEEVQSNLDQYSEDACGRPFGGDSSSG